MCVGSLPIAKTLNVFQETVVYKKFNNTRNILFMLHMYTFNLHDFASCVVYVVLYKAVSVSYTV